MLTYAVRRLSAFLKRKKKVCGTFRIEILNANRLGQNFKRGQLWVYERNPGRKSAVSVKLINVEKQLCYSFFLFIIQCIHTYRQKGIADPTRRASSAWCKANFLLRAGGGSVSRRRSPSLRRVLRCQLAAAGARRPGAAWCCCCRWR